MKQIDTLIHARWVIPIEPADTVFEHHAIAVHEGRIVEILPSSTAKDYYQPTSELQLDKHAVLPGLINSHSHTAMNLMRGIADDLPLMDWLQNHIWPAEQQFISPDFVHDGCLLASAEMLRSGTTCVNDMYYFPEDSVRAFETAGIRASVGLILIEFPSAYAQNADEYLSKGIELHDQLHNNSLITTTFAPHAPYTVSDESFTRIATYAEELDIPIHMHVHETADEVAQEIDKSGISPIERINNLGLLSPRLQAVHMTQLTEDEIQLCADAGVHVLHCPESNLKLASGFCPANTLHMAGINITLGTDGAASNNDLDMFGEMRTAALLAKGVASDASVLPAELVLRMATINGAKALGLENEIGSLEPGKSADIIAVDLSNVETQPVYNPVSQLVYSTGRSQVTDVWVAGKHLLKDRVLTTLDMDEIIAKAKQWHSKLKH